MLYHIIEAVLMKTVNNFWDSFMFCYLKMIKLIFTRIYWIFS